MAEVGQRWRLLQADERGMLVEVTRSCVGVGFARDLCGSRATASRLLAAQSLRYKAPCYKAPGEVRNIAEGRYVLPNDRLERGARIRLVFGDGVAPVGQQSKGADSKGEPLERGRCGEQPNLSEQFAADIPVDILYEDPFCLAVNKPAGLLVHSSGANGPAPTLTDLVCAHLRSEGSPAATRVQAVQRLDVETTGAVLFSKTRELQPRFDALVAGHDMHKSYLAVVVGRVGPGELRVDAPIGRDRHDSHRMRVGPSGKPSVTLVRGLACEHGFSLVCCRLLTGRRHQIRVHLAHIGHPIVGDTVYGGPRSRDGMMLHAAHESFVHPVTGEPVVIEAPWPERFSAYFAPRVLEHL